MRHHILCFAVFSVLMAPAACEAQIVLQGNTQVQGNVTLGAAPPSVASLSQNSGINANDTCVVFDLAIPMQSVSSTLPLPTFTLNYHVELGYDANGQVIANIWPTGGSPFTGELGTVSVIRLSQGAITLFDQNGVLVPYSPTISAPAFNPLGLLGTNPGASVVSRLVVPSIQQHAQRMHFQLNYNSPYYVLSTTYSGGPLTSEQWTYAVSGNQYVATQVTYSLNLSGASTALTPTLQFSNIQWNDNPANDTARTNLGFTATSPPTATSATPSLAQQSDSGCPAASSNLGGTQNVVFQYGLFSSGCSWKRMIGSDPGWLNQYFIWGNELAPNHGLLSTLDAIESQGGTLVNDIQTAINAGGPAANGHYILIGQSQGGLVSRYAAQSFQSQYGVNNPYVKGVVAMDTPNQGAPLADWAQIGAMQGLAAIENKLFDYVGCNTIYDNGFCFLLGVVEASMTATAGYLYGASSAIELEPGSSFVTNLNNFPENFPKAAVIGHAHRIWVEARVADSFACGLPYVQLQNCYPEQAYGERNFAAAYGYAFDAAFGTWIVSTIICDWTGDPLACDIADFTLPIWTTMLYIDVGWNFITTVTPQQSLVGYLSPFWNDEDGVVPSSSQTYPSTPCPGGGCPTAIQYAVNPSDSHMGETKSDLTRNVLEVALASQPFIVQTQASCTFSSSSPPVEVSASGGTGTFALNTQTGCQWNAVSQQAWISITSGASGTSSGTIGFTAAPNPQSVPRTGTIVAGSGGPGVTFTVNQDGLCLYSLSPVGPLAIQPSGGTFGIAVTASAGCVWSASSNASWIAINVGASGTGSGSFSFTASPNLGPSVLSGTISVMNQTLTVMIGSPVGTPGSGWVSIQGSEQEQTFNMCPNQYPYYCPATIPDYGTISVTVEGETSTIGYGCCADTPATLAAQLASAINQQPNSPIFAAVSGSTVTITSTINGAATNYPLVLSYTYNSTYFSSPAIWATASGPSLAGGTD